MKKIFTPILALVLSTLSINCTSCNNDDSNDIETVITINELPEQAQVFIKTYFPDDKVSKVERNFEDNIVYFEVDLSSGIELVFDSKGLWQQVDAPYGMTLPEGFILEPITQFLHLNYQGYGINEINRIGLGYKVELVSGLSLLFDQIGDFVKIINED